MSRPTLVSLAQELGVSRQTVSNVINQPHLVRESTRVRVQAAIERSGYRPSAAAQALRKQKSMTLALRLYPISDGISHEVMDRFLHRVVEQAEGLGHRVMLYTADNDAAEVEALIDLHERNLIDGCLLTETSRDDPRIQALDAAGVTFAAFGRPWGQEQEATHPWVDVDGRAGMCMATEHLLGMGHHRVGLIAWPEGATGFGDDRVQGWYDATTAAHPEWHEADLAELVVRFEDGITAGVTAMGELSERGCDAVVCVSDSFAVGAQQVLRNDEDPFVPVIGFDDTPSGRALGLSSVSQPVETAAALLVRALIQPDSAPVHGDGPLAVVPGVPMGRSGRLLSPSLQIRRAERVDLQEFSG